MSLTSVLRGARSGCHGDESSWASSMTRGGREDKGREGKEGGDGNSASEWGPSTSSTS